MANTSTTHFSATRFGTGPAAFDPAYYLNRNPDVAAALSHLNGNDRNLAALKHFIDTGATEMRNPSALFDMKAYRAAYPDTAGLNPWQHFRSHGMREGRQAFAVEEAPRPSLGASPAPDGACFDLASLPQAGAHPSFLNAEMASGQPTAMVAATPQQAVLAHAAPLLDPAGFAFLPVQPAAATGYGLLPRPEAAPGFAAMLHGNGDQGALLPGLPGPGEAAALPGA